MCKRGFLITVISIALVCIPTAFLFAEKDRGKEIIKDTLFGAGIGAISAKASGGKAGKGALVGAGTNVFGKMLLGSLSEEEEPAQRRYYYEEDPYYAPPRRTTRDYSYQQGSKSRLQEAYEQGYEEGYRIGYRDGLRDAKSGF